MTNKSKKSAPTRSKSLSRPVFKAPDTRHDRRHALRANAVGKFKQKSGR